MGQLNFSFSDFKKWMKKNDNAKTEEQKNNQLIGLTVETKISTKRLAARIRPKDGELHELVSDFKQNGGIIYDVNGKEFLVEVNSGFFYIPRFLVKKSK